MRLALVFADLFLERQQLLSTKKVSAFLRDPLVLLLLCQTHLTFSTSPTSSQQYLIASNMDSSLGNRVLDMGLEDGRADPRP